MAQTKTMNPYDVLGVDKKATAADARRAYKAKAKKAHPDKGGTAEAFHQLSTALIVLTDEAKRAKYDATGDIDGGSPDNTHAKAVEILTMQLAQFVGEFVDGNGGDPESADVVEFLRLAVKRKLGELRAQKAPFDHFVDKAGRVLRRLSKKEGASGTLLLAFEQHVRTIRARADAIQEAIGWHESALKMCDDYAYDPASPVGIVMMQFTTA